MIKILLILFVLVVSSADASTYYLDDDAANDSGVGSQIDPWKTLSKAQSVAISGDTIILSTGDYGTYLEANPSTRTSYVTYQAASGATVHFDNIFILNTSTIKDTFLRFVGINIQPDSVDPCATAQTGCNDPMYASSGSDTYAKTENAVVITYANHVVISGSAIEGQNKYLTLYAISLSDSQEITIEDCDIKTATRAMTFLGISDGISIKNSHIHGIVASAVTEGSDRITGVLIEGNNIHDSYYSILENYCPKVDPQNIYHGSGIVIRQGDITIRNNIIHDGFPSAGIMCYEDLSAYGSHYDNVTIENNLIYDIRTSYAIRVYHLGDNFLVRNNTIIGTFGDGGGTTYFNTALAVHTLDDDVGSPMITLDNNVFLGAVYTLEANVTQNNNYFYSWRNGAAWQCSPLVDGSTVLTCKDYNFASPATLNSLFTCGSYCNFTTANHGETIDYSLSSGSPLTNFGSVALQTTDSLGTIGVDGFIRTNGVARSAALHSAGAYEYGTGIPHQTFRSGTAALRTGTGNFIAR